MIMHGMNALPAIRPSQHAVETIARNAALIRSHVRMTSPVLTEACRLAGAPAYALCAGVLASVVDDLIQISRLDRSDFERTKRKQRVLAAAQEPAASALRIAIAASPVNGRAAVAHWDVICEHYEVGKLAWLLGLDTETARKYSKKVDKRA
jgi:hypothetical protein